MDAQSVVDAACAFLKRHRLILATAESCTAGKVIELLAQVPGSGACLDVGYVVYSEQAKKRVLGVQSYTIDTFSLTSEEVAREMVRGALQNSAANVAIATTGIAGPDDLDGVAAGTVCLTWGFQRDAELVLFSRREHFPGNRRQVIESAALHALRGIALFHEKWQRGERG
ncbi:MAG TPA: CinA family protein [Pseudomonas sp.]|nr:CinA family protein [Pseudomonas sp.]